MLQSEVKNNYSLQEVKPTSSGLLDSQLLLLLGRFSSVRLCATPQTAAHQAPPSLGFSRQEQWSGLPFPSPMRESEKWKWSRSVVSNSLRPHGLQPTRLLRPWDFPGKSTGVGCHCLLHASQLTLDKESACNAGDPGSIPGSRRPAGEGIGYPLQYSWASLVAQLVKNQPAMRETWVRSLGW